MKGLRLEPKLANIYDFLVQARQRPSMYFGNCSLSVLETFCHGYYQALRIHDIQEVVPKLDVWHFGEWLRQRFDWSTCAGWSTAIRSNCSTDKEAFERFMEFIDEYRQLYSVLIAEVHLAFNHKPTGQGYILGNGSWMLPPSDLRICQWKPDNFFVMTEIYPSVQDDRNTFTSLERAFAFAEKMWQVKPTEWTLRSDKDGSQ